jgi:hypothetical protein
MKSRIRSAPPARALACHVVALLLAAAAPTLGAEPIFADGFEQLGAPGEACVDPMIQPADWIRINRSWETVWSSPDGFPAATYPSSVGFPVPIGVDKFAYKAVSFIPNPNETVGISWEGVQPNPVQGYSPPRPATGMWFSLSPCAGDLRAPDASSSDPFLQAGCRRGGASGGLIFSTTAFQSNHQACHLEAGTRYWLTIVAANPEDGLDPLEHTCAPLAASALGCDVQATHRPQ